MIPLRDDNTPSRTTIVTRALVVACVLQLASTLLAGDAEGGGVAFGAHIGGFVAGMLLIPRFKRRGVSLRLPFGSS
jgi:membrane associated rhomboid family serine protease